MGKKSRRNRVKCNSQLVRTNPELVADLYGPSSLAALKNLHDLVAKPISSRLVRVAAIVRSGGLDAITRLMRTHNQDTRVQHWGFRLLCVAGLVEGSDDSKRAIATSGGVPVLITSLSFWVAQELPYNETTPFAALVTSGMILLCIMSRYGENVWKLMLDAGGFAWVVEILKRTRAFSVEESKRVLCTEALRLMHEITTRTVCYENYNSEELSSFVTEILRYGGIPNVLATLAYFPGEDDILRFGNWMILVMSSVEWGGNPSHVLAASGDTVMKDILERNVSRNPELANTARIAIDLLQEVVPNCRHCDRESVDMMVCSRCGITWYCNDGCIAADWTNHMAECNVARWRLRRNQEAHS